MNFCTDSGIILKVYLQCACFFTITRVLPHLARKDSLLVEDSEVTLALFRKLTYLRGRLLPTNHHEDVRLLLDRLLFLLKSGQIRFGKPLNLVLNNLVQNSDIHIF